MSIATPNTSPQETGAAETTGTQQIVSFHLAAETYGVEITKVREIILICDITQVPQTPHYVKGLINLRSTVIPVIDLRARFGLPEAERTGDTRIMVINVGTKTVGIIVDGVDEVLRISHDQIAPAPPTIASLGNEYLNGLVKLDDQLLILLDIDKILGQDEQVLDAVAAAG
ncbi:MAG TPA: chemotaxis protein CheW [Thermoguttaceae bacterium]|nr:chemotaxis protein CheW [Thermoguttaceae bacterium]